MTVSNELLPCPFCGSNDIDAEGWGTTAGICGPSGNQWARMLHREQIDAISFALQQTKEKENG